MSEYLASPVPSQESAPSFSKYSNLPGVFTLPIWHHLPITFDALTHAAQDQGMFFADEIPSPESVM